MNGFLETAGKKVRPGFFLGFQINKTYFSKMVKKEVKVESSKQMIGGFDADSKKHKVLITGASLKSAKWMGGKMCH